MDRALGLGWSRVSFPMTDGRTWVGDWCWHSDEAVLTKLCRGDVQQYFMLDGMFLGGWECLGQRHGSCRQWVLLPSEVPASTNDHAVNVAAEARGTRPL